MLQRQQEEEQQQRHSMLHMPSNVAIQLLKLVVLIMQLLINVQFNIILGCMNLDCLKKCQCKVLVV